MALQTTTSSYSNNNQLQCIQTDSSSSEQTDPTTWQPINQSVYSGTPENPSTSPGVTRPRHCHLYFSFRTAMLFFIIISAYHLKAQTYISTKYLLSVNNCTMPLQDSTYNANINQVIKETTTVELPHSTVFSMVNHINSYTTNNEIHFSPSHFKRNEYAKGFHPYVQNDPFIHLFCRRKNNSHSPFSSLKCVSGKNCRFIL